MFRSRNSGVVFLSWFFVLLWMFIIFIFSGQTGDQSGDLSGGFVAFVKIFVEIIFPNVNDLEIHYIVRKSAHIVEYVILSMLLVNALRQHIANVKQQFIWVFIVAFVYAITDEIHQYFVPLRTASVIDVLFDSLGIIIGLLIMYQLTSKREDQSNLE